MKRSYLLIAIIVIPFLLSAGIGYVFWKGHSSNTVPAGSDPIPADAQAAMAGVSAIYTIDYQQPDQDWLDRVCAVSTADGCQVTTNWVEPALMAAAKQYKIQTGCSVIPVSAVDTLNDGSRVWKLHVRFDHPWTPDQAEQTTFAIVARVDGAWKFERILFNQEAAKYQEGTK